MLFDCQMFSYSQKLKHDPSHVEEDNLDMIQDPSLTLWRTILITTVLLQMRNSKSQSHQLHQQFHDHKFIVMNFSTPSQQNHDGYVFVT